MLGMTGDESAQGSSDTSHFNACARWHNVLVDIDAGILTDREIRTKLGEIYEDAQYAETPGVGQRAQALYAAATQGDSEAFAQAALEFTNACTGLL